MPTAVTVIARCSSARSACSDRPSSTRSCRPRARLAGDLLETFGDHPVSFPVTPTGAAVALLALEGARVDVLVSGTPTYIRPSEAEVKYPDGVPGALKKR